MKYELHEDDIYEILLKAKLVDSKLTREQLVKLQLDEDLGRCLNT